MRRSPFLHLALGALIITYAYIAGLVVHNQPTPGIVTITSSGVPNSAPMLPVLTNKYDLIVKYKKTPSITDAFFSRHNLGVALFQNYSEMPGFAFESITTQDNLSLDDVIAMYQADPNVEYVEPNLRYELDKAPTKSIKSLAMPNDPYFQELWGLSNTGQKVKGKPGGVNGVDINALKAWGITTGSEDIVVAIVDTGIDYTHPDLKDNIWVNDKEIPDNGIDDDGNGVIDDVHGYNAINDSGDPMDDNAHGTHCAGTIGASGDNGEGIVGVNWKVKLMGLKFLSGDGGGSLSDALKTINYAIEMKRRGVNIRVLSNSWGGGGFSHALYDAIQELNAEGILFVAAAGNSAVDTDRNPHYPSAYDVENVLSVAAIDNQDKLAVFSNYGAKTVDVAAPGVDIYSTTPGNEYEHFSGTSMATPHVSGVAALMLAHNPKLSPKQLVDKVIKSAKPTASLNGKVVSGGRVDAYAALQD